ncbi:MAG TPA: hypothetical protein ENN29_12415 [Candidatus Hydrogenedentes bacterium]|nr:hypothetical protein [Candidatus Hydrogenedentota bacterium]
MDGSIRELIKTLDNYENGWVVRRDAAEALGKIANAAVTALSAHLKDRDMDVLIAVESNLQSVKALLRQEKEEKKKEYTLRELAQSCAVKGECEVHPQDGGYVATVNLSNGRHHRVFIMRSKSRDGRDMVRIFSLCGKSNKDYEHWALKLNRKSCKSAFALQPWNNAEYLILVNNIMKNEVTPELIQDRVREMAVFGDWLEEKIEGTDEL